MTDVEAVAAHVMAVIQALSTLARDGGTPSKLDGVVREVMRGLALRSLPSGAALAMLHGMPYRHTTEENMPKSKIAVTLDPRTLQRVDRLVRAARYPNRSQAIEAVISAQLDRIERRGLLEQCAKLDPAEERTFADEGFAADVAEWPEY